MQRQRIGIVDYRDQVLVFVASETIILWFNIYSTFDSVNNTKYMLEDARDKYKA